MGVTAVRDGAWPVLGLGCDKDAWVSSALGTELSVLKELLFRPAGACFVSGFYPRLTPWAAFLRRFAAKPLGGLSRRVAEGTVFMHRLPGDDVIAGSDCQRTMIIR